MEGLLNRYRAYLEAERNASRYTVRNYINDLMGTDKRGPGKGFVQFLKLRGLVSLEQVEKQAIRDYVAWLMEQGVVKRSIARRISAIRSFYRYLLRENIITAERLPLSVSRKRGARAASFSLKLDKRLPSFLTHEEAANLLANPGSSKPVGLRDRALIELMYASGMRVSELASLELGQVRLDSREITVRGKGSKERVTLMGEPAAAALSLYINRARPQLLKGKASAALFLTRFGTRLPARDIQRRLETLSKKAGIDRRVHPHMLRHTFATHMLDGGADLRVVQELLGHADLSSTQVYTHVSRRQARKVYLAAHPLARKQADGR